MGTQFRIVGTPYTRNNYPEIEMDGFFDKVKEKAKEILDKVTGKVKETESNVKEKVVDIFNKQVIKMIKAFYNLNLTPGGKWLMLLGPAFTIYCKAVRYIVLTGVVQNYHGIATAMAQYPNSAAVKKVLVLWYLLGGKKSTLLTYAKANQNKNQQKLLSSLKHVIEKGNLKNLIKVAEQYNAEMGVAGVDDAAVAAAGTSASAAGVTILTTIATALRTLVTALTKNGFFDKAGNYLKNKIPNKHNDNKGKSNNLPLLLGLGLLAANQ